MFVEGNAFLNSDEMNTTFFEDKLTLFQINIESNKDSYMDALGYHQPQCILSAQWLKQKALDAERRLMMIKVSYGKLFIAIRWASIL